MDTKFQTSFIPKKTSVDAPRRASFEQVSVFLLVSIIIFIISLAAAGGVFVYKRVLTSRIADMDALLVKAKNAFEPGFLDNLNQFNKRIEASKKVLVAHTAVTPLFDLLQEETLGTVKFTNFSYTLADAGGASILLSGAAKNFSSVALQSDVFGQEKNLKNPVFSDLNPDASGNILFKFSAGVDPSLISYKRVYGTVTPVPTE